MAQYPSERDILLDELSRPRRPRTASEPGTTASRLYPGGSPTFDERLPGGGRVDAPPQPAPAPEAAAKPDFSTWGQYMGSKNAALDPQKVASNHDSPKYQIARVLSHFDPAQGLTPDVINALNTLGIGQFASDNGQYLRVTGQADPRFEGVLGADMVRNFSKDGAEKRWGGWGSVNPEGPGVRRMAPIPAMSSPASAAPMAADGSVYQNTVQTLDDLERQILLQQLAPRRAQPRRA